MLNSDDRPIIVQSDGTILLDVHSANFQDARDDISGFAELIKSPEHIHTYEISSLSLWNAASAGISPEQAIASLDKWSRFKIPENIIFKIKESGSLFGKIILLPSEFPEKYILKVTDDKIFLELLAIKKLQKYLLPLYDQSGFYISALNRGIIKQELITQGYPVRDNIPLASGDSMEISFRKTTSSGKPFSIRNYQEEAAQAFYGNNLPGNGYGTIVLACGSGKTVVGMRIMELCQTKTLILTTNIAAVHQWINELLDKTTLTRDDIGEYSGDKKEIKPVTIATYQILTWRPGKEENFPHFELFKKDNWGLVIYDEVHLLPAPVFRITAEIQAISRVGLTATLIREDGLEKNLFSLVGPKRFDCPWKILQEKGWIAQASCHEIRIELPEELKIPYATATRREKFRIASENPRKMEIIKEIIENRKDDFILIIGQYLSQLKEVKKLINVPLITGQTPNKLREEIYAKFREGKERIIIVSKVANFAIDLPDASVAIQISGSFGSRQEEAQRLGRILRPKERNSYFYSLTSRFTVEEEFSANRQKFLTEQGYEYQIETR
ncbi:MAG: DEAD/DEAH box helicase [Spirochaetia bacterium]|nr:DEAD/DEAH box helicase [Spirochaetia bacterium]